MRISINPAPNCERSDIRAYEIEVCQNLHRGSASTMTAIGAQGEIFSLHVTENSRAANRRQCDSRN